MTDGKTEAVDEEEAEEQPAIEDEEFADIDPDAIADEVEREVGAAGDEDSPDVNEESAAAEGEAAVEEGDLDLDSETWGDLYVGTLTTFSNALIEEYGTEDAEAIEEDLARQLHLDAYMNDWLASKGKREDMPPEQALLISTCIFMVVVVGSKTELPSMALEEVDL